MINSTQINLNHYQMTACYYPNGVLSKPLERFRFLNTIKLNYGVNNVKLDDLITTILMVHCKMNIMGYNTITQKYWGKKYNGTICELHIELQINNCEQKVTKVFDYNKVSMKFKNNLNLR
jgi:hypothetical protein